MKLVVCLDDQNGLLFNNRRLSKDSCLRKRLLEVSKNAPLWMNAYSAAQFTEGAESIKVDEAFLEKAGQDAYCFVENADVTSYAEQVQVLIVYRWNRLYPADTVFPLSLFTDKWKMVSSLDFPGSSHEKLTEEVYAP